MLFVLSIIPSIKPILTLPLLGCVYAALIFSMFQNMFLFCLLCSCMHYIQLAFYYIPAVITQTIPDICIVTITATFPAFKHFVIHLLYIVFSSKHKHVSSGEGCVFPLRFPAGTLQTQCPA